MQKIKLDWTVGSVGQCREKVDFTEGFAVIPKTLTFLSSTGSAWMGSSLFLSSDISQLFPPSFSVLLFFFFHCHIFIYIKMQLGNKSCLDFDSMGKKDTSACLFVRALYSAEFTAEVIWLKYTTAVSNHPSFCCQKQLMWIAYIWKKNFFHFKPWSISRGLGRKMNGLICIN